MNNYIIILRKTKYLNIVPFFCVPDLDQLFCLLEDGREVTWP